MLPPPAGNLPRVLHLPTWPQTELAHLPQAQIQPPRAPCGWPAAHAPKSKEKWPPGRAVAQRQGGLGGGLALGGGAGGGQLPQPAGRGGQVGLEGDAGAGLVHDVELGPRVGDNNI